MAVRPAVAGFAELLNIEFARGEQDLAQFAADAVAVDVGVDVGVGPQGLYLGNRVVEGLPVPKTDIFKRGLIGGDVDLSGGGGLSL